MILYKKGGKLKMLPISKEEYAEAAAKFGPFETAWQCSLGKEEKGYFFYTHRGRSKAHPQISEMTEKEFKFINSTS